MKLWPFGKAKSAIPPKTPLFANFGIQAPELQVAESVETTTLPSATAETLMAASTLQHYAAETPYDDDPFITVDSPEPEAPVDWASLGPNCLDADSAPLGLAKNDEPGTAETFNPSKQPETTLDVDVFSSLSGSLIFGQVTEQSETPNLAEGSELASYQQHGPLLQPGAVSEDSGDNSPSRLSAPDAYEQLGQTALQNSQEELCLQTLSPCAETPQQPWQAADAADEAPEQPWSASQYAETPQQPWQAADAADKAPEQPWSASQYAETPQQPWQAADAADEAPEQPWSASQYAETPQQPWQAADAADEAPEQPWSASQYAETPQQPWQAADAADEAPEQPWSASQYAETPQQPWQAADAAEPKLYQDIAASKTFDPYDPLSYTAMPVVTTSWAPEPEQQMTIDELPPTHGLYEHLVQLHARCLSDQAHHTADRVNNLVNRYFASAGF